MPVNQLHSINCILEDAHTAKRIDFSDGSLASSSPVVLVPYEWLKYRCREGRTLSGIPDSSDLFTMTCLDGDHTMTHCKSVQCGVPLVIAHATPLGSCFVTITYGEQVEYQCEADYYLDSELASWIGQHDRPFPSHEWLEDRSRVRCEEMSHWAVLVMGLPGTGKSAGARHLVSRVQGTFLECDVREVEVRKLVELILKRQGCLRQTSVAVLNFDTDVTDELKWRLWKAVQQLKIPLIFVSDDGIVNQCAGRVGSEVLVLGGSTRTTERSAGVATNDARERARGA